MNFRSFSFHPAVFDGIRKAGYDSPTPIQEKTIPEIIKGRDVVGLAQTGTGKTAAFVLPILNRLMEAQRGRVGALIIAPTRELAEQTYLAARLLGKKTRLNCVAVYGGVAIVPQIKALKRADIVVGCPGRILDHIRRRTLDLSRLETLVLDEADLMFDMGFLPDIKTILSYTKQEKRQTLLFSATMPDAIRGLAEEILHNPIGIKIGNSAPANTVSHALFPISSRKKTDLLIKLLDTTEAGSFLVFTRTKSRAQSLDETLVNAGYKSTSLQGDLSQGRRRAALNSFRTGQTRILVATDIAARGIDISHVSHVINYDMPATPEDYIHRVGRTGRAERSGQAFTFVTKEDNRKIRAINRLIGDNVEQRMLSDFDYDDEEIKGGTGKKSWKAVKKEKNRAAKTYTPKAHRKGASPASFHKGDVAALTHEKEGSAGNERPKDRSSRNAKGRKKNTLSGAEARSGKGTFAWLSPRKAKKTKTTKRSVM